MIPENVFAYSAPVWQRFSGAAHAGALDGSDVITAEAGSAAVRALLRIQVRVAGGVVHAAKFRAYGCPTAIAVGEWLAAGLEGKTVADLRAPAVAEIRRALEIPDDRAHCALMGEDVIRQLLKQVAP
ncbi:MAG: iron-sulfur cluster assembly scaffold protein [Stenotrophobium sp.]